MTVNEPTLAKNVNQQVKPIANVKDYAEDGSAYSVDTRIKSERASGKNSRVGSTK